MNHLPPTQAYLCLALTAPPIAVAVSYLFHLAVERRFMPGHLQKLDRKRAESQAVAAAR